MINAVLMNLWAASSNAYTDTPPSVDVMLIQVAHGMNAQMHAVNATASHLHQTFVTLTLSSVSGM
jgi:hypothetical protein